MLDKRITTFLAVAACGSMNRAASQLYVSPTAVMNEINKLEAHLGFPLFVRTNRGLVLTQSGEVFFQDAKHIAALSKEAISKAKQLSNPSQVQIRIGSSLLRSCAPFMNVWNELEVGPQQYTLSVVPFNDDSMDSIFHSLGTDFDIMGSICDITNWKRHYQFVPLWNSRFNISVYKNHPLATRRLLTIEDLFDQRILFIQTGTSAIIDNIRMKLSKYPRIQIEDYQPHYDFGIFNQCAQEKIMVLSNDMWDDVHPMLRSVPVHWNYTIPYGISYPLHPSPQLLQFINMIRTAHMERQCHKLSISAGAHRTAH